MPYLASLNQTADKILALVASQPNPSLLLDDLAVTLGQCFQADACLAMVAPENLWQHAVTSSWQVDDSIENFTELSFTDLWQQLQTVEVERADRCEADIFELANGELNNFFTSPTSSVVVTFSGNTNAAIVLSKSGNYAWQSREKQELTEISRAIAIATLQIELQQKALVQADYQSLLSSFSQDVADSSDLELIFNAALAEVAKALKLERAKIITLKYKDPYYIQIKRQQKIKATLTIAESWTTALKKHSLPKGFSFQLTNSELFRQALSLAPQALAIDQGIEFPDLAPEFLPSSERIPHKSAVLLVPLMGKKVNSKIPALVLGFLVLQRNDVYNWSQAEIELIQWVAVQLSTALIHSQTLTQVNSIVEERTSQLKWSLDVQAKLSEKMRQQIEQLKNLNELKDDFLSSMSHELKTPMTSMKMAIKMLRQNIPESMRTKYLDILEQEWHREFNLIKDLLKLQQVESGELAFSPQELYLGQIIEDISTSFRQKWQAEKGLQLDLDFPTEELKLNSDFDSLNNIINELLLNAAKYSDVDSTVDVMAKEIQTLQGKYIELSVANNGVPIEANELPYIFEKFRRGRGVTDRAVPGTGLGLTLVKHLVEHLNGEIRVTSDPTADSELYKTTFTVTLPQK